MKGPYLLDTNIASYIIKGKSPAVDRRLVKVPVAEVLISAVTEAELRYGVARHPEGIRLRDLVDEFLMTVTILSWDSAAAKQYGQLRASLEREGLPMENLDLMIAAHALAREVVFVTNDSAFARIRNLKLTDWTKG